MIIFVLGLFKFSLIENYFMRFPLYINFIFVTTSYRSSSPCYCSTAAGPCFCSFSSLLTAGYCCCSPSALFSTIFFSLSCSYPIFSTILLYNKEAVSRMPCSLSASTSRVAVAGSYRALYNFEMVFLKNEFVV